jgi:hypothetical protein
MEAMMTGAFNKTGIALGVVFVVALGLNVAVGFLFGIDRPMESDAHYFLHLAGNMADGHGYVVKESFWPDTPSMRRLPGWPATVYAALKIAPSMDRDLLMRLVGMLVNSMAAVAVGAVALAVTQAPLAALVAGLLYALHPAALFYASGGDSEPLFALLTGAGVACLLAAKSARWAGAVLLGLACLVRANFVLMAPIVVVLALVARIRPERTECRRFVTMLLIFLVPACVWILRNHRVAGEAPVLSTLRGQTFYGGNNPVVATNMGYWGYWVFPNQIPGETPMADLARTKSEYETDDYYFRRGIAYIKGNLHSYPLLLVGKCVRAYIPIPWKPGWGSLGVCCYRWLLYAAFLVGLCAAWRQTRGDFWFLLIAMLGTNLATVLMFYGSMRFAFPLEPFLLPHAAIGVISMLKRRQT